MKLEDQYCTVPQAINLWELGVGLNSQSSWCWNGSKKTPAGEKDFFINPDGFLHEWPEAYCAYSVAELGLALPSQLPATKLFKGLILQCMKPWEESESFLTGYIELNEDLDTGGWVHTKDGPTEAQSRADMLIYLLESNLITAEEVNNLLTQ